MKRWLIPLALMLSACTQAQGAQEYPAPIQALVSKGITIKGSLDAPAGFKGYAADYHGRPLPIYLLPDGQHAMVGTLYDASGNDLTDAPMRAATEPVLDASSWAMLGKASWIAEGATHPKRIVYVFTDTECPYCHKLWQATQPRLADGDVQVRHIMVAVIAPQSLGRAAAILDDADPKAALHRHESAFGHSPIKPEASPGAATMRRIEANNALMDSLGISATPATLYKDDAGKIHRLDGMLDDDTLKRVFGG